MWRAKKTPERRDRLVRLKKSRARHLSAHGDNKDKSGLLSIVLPAVSAILVALIGALFTYWYNARQADNSRVELVSKLVPDLLSGDSAKQEAALITVASLGNEELALRLSSILDTDSWRKVLGNLLLAGVRTADDRLVNLVGRTGIAGRYSQTIPTDPFGRNPYQLAVLFNNVAAIDALARYQASPDSTSSTDSGYRVPPAIILAAENGNVPVFQALVRAGSTMGASSAVLSAAAGSGRIAVLGETRKIDNRLAHLNEVFGGQPTPLTAASGARSVEAVKWLLDAGADANRVDGNKETALTRVLARTDGLEDENSPAVTQILALLIQHGAATTVTIKNKPTFSAVHATVETRQNEALDLLLRNKADPNSNVNGESPLAVAAHFDNRTAAELLLKYGADPNYDNGEALIEAVNLKHPDVLELLLRHGGTTNIKGVSLIELTARDVAYTGPRLDPEFEAESSQKEQESRLRCLEMLIEAGEKVDSMNEFGHTGLYTAADRLDKQFVQRLLQAGASPDLGQPFSETPTYVAATRDDPELFRLVLVHSQRQAELFGPDKQPLPQIGNPEIRQILLKGQQKEGER